VKVAIIHDALTQYGGAERVLEQICALYPEAPIMVALHDAARMSAAYRSRDIRTSWLDRMPLARRKHRWLLPFYPQAFESFDLGAYDLVISSAYAFAHGVLTGPETLHINYCHSPGRFFWDYHRYAERERLSGPIRALLSPQLARLRQWDRLAADRPDSWIATSRLVQQRIRKFYGKESTIISPPVDVTRFEVGEGSGGYFLMLMRLVGWKRPDIVVEACTRLNVPLVVAGDGRDFKHLQSIAGPNVRFVGRVNDAQMRPLYRDCRGFILPAEEDFGITPLEAMASGRPVIALGRGGVLDTVIPGRTGVFFAEQTVECLADTLACFDTRDFNPRLIRHHAEGFDNSVFRQRLKGFIEAALAQRAAQHLSGAAPSTALAAA
jgi:glycosyltransferase involved in cell wall biosynthesis